MPHAKPPLVRSKGRSPYSSSKRTASAGDRGWMDQAVEPIYLHHHARVLEAPSPRLVKARVRCRGRALGPRRSKGSSTEVRGCCYKSLYATYKNAWGVRPALLAARTKTILTPEGGGQLRVFEVARMIGSYCEGRLRGVLLWVCAYCGSGQARRRTRTVQQCNSRTCWRLTVRVGRSAECCGLRAARRALPSLATRRLLPRHTYRHDEATKLTAMG